MLDTRVSICYTKKVEWRCGCSSMVESQPSKLIVRVRFPLPAPLKACECMVHKLIFYFETFLKPYFTINESISIDEISK